MMSQSDFRLTVLGARGSVPVCRSSVFGGDTSCYLVEAGDEHVFLDAGSGLIFAPELSGKAPVILLSHLHLDHILGLGMYPRLSEKGAVTRLRLPCSSAAEAGELLAALYAPPFWPLPLTDYAGRLDIETIPRAFSVGEIEIDTMQGRHPGGCVIFRLRYSGKALVYVTDYEPDDASFEALTTFSRGAALILYDAQYTRAEYEKRRGFGHSTAGKGIELLEKSGAKQLLLIHHDPHATDEELLRRERELGRADVRYARQGEEIKL